jgi:tRNA(fMet)-specific endonuclease VapC
VIHLDSAFLVDLQREHVRGRPGGALDFIESVDESEIVAASVHVVAEMRTGAELSRRPLQANEALDRLLSNLVVSYPDARFAPMYARLAAALQRTGQLIARMDLLIATAAIVDDAPLVTRNVKDFSRVPGLRVLPY